MNKVSVLIENRLEFGSVESELVAVVPVYEEDQWLAALEENDGSVLEASEVVASDCEFEDGFRVYVLCVMQEDEILAALYVTDDEEEAAEKSEELSNERQEEVVVLEACFCVEGDE
jgi:hypothetical protein